MLLILKKEKKKKQKEECVLSPYKQKLKDYCQSYFYDIQTIVSYHIRTIKLLNPESLFLFLGYTMTIIIK